MSTNLNSAASKPGEGMLDIDLVQVAEDLSTVWVHGRDGSTVGRFSVQFGIDIHTTATQQLAGSSQCLHCTHEAPSHDDWLRFCQLVQDLHGISVPEELLGNEVFERRRQEQERRRLQRES